MCWQLELTDWVTGLGYLGDVWPPCWRALYNCWQPPCSCWVDSHRRRCRTGCQRVDPSPASAAPSHPATHCMHAPIPHPTTPQPTPCSHVQYTSHMPVGVPILESISERQSVRQMKVCVGRHNNSLHTWRWRLTENTWAVSTEDC